MISKKNFLLLLLSFYSQALYGAKPIHSFGSLPDEVKSGILKYLGRNERKDILPTNRVL